MPKRSLPLLVLPLLALSTFPARATLVDYYTLDSDSAVAGGGRSDSSGSTAGGGDLATMRGTGTVSVVPGIIGSALSFPNTLDFTTGTVASGNVALPFTLSIWVDTTANISETDKALGLEDSSQNADDFSLALVNANRAGAQVARNSTVGPINTTGANPLNNGQWHLLTGVFTGTQDRSLYVDGVLAARDTTNSVALYAPSAAVFLNVGGFLRNTSSLVDAFNGALDDAGFFNTALTAADISLINGLGQTGSLGLDQLGAAQSLNGSANGTTSSFGGFTWEKVTGLTGATGAYGGTTAAGNAFIVTDGAAGTGIEVVPEPVTGGLLLLGFGLLGLRRRRPL